MKKFLIEIEDEEWEKVIKEMRERYSKSDPHLLSHPPTDNCLFADYLYALWCEDEIRDMADFQVTDAGIGV